MLLKIHVVCFFVGIAALCLAFFFSLFLLLADHALKSKRFGSLDGLLRRLPPLERLDTWTIRLVGVSFPLYSIGLALGYILAHDRWQGGWAADPKVLFALLCWLWYAAFLLIRLGLRWRGKRLAWLNVVGFAAVLFTVLGVRWVFSSGKHPFL